MLKQTAFISLAFAFLAAIACSSSSNGGKALGAGGDDGGDSTGSGSVKSYCAASCEKEHGCDKKVDVQTCTNDCKNDFAAVGPKLRDDFLASITDCYEGEDCVAVLDDKALDSCTAEAVAELAPSKEGSSFCTDYEAAIEKCDGTFVKAECLNKAKTFNDDSLKEAEACLDKTCSDIDDCVEATLGSVGSSSVDNPGTGGTSGNGGSGNSGGSANNGGSGNPSGGTGNTGPLSGACTSTSPSECASTTSINTCVDGMYSELTCKDYWGAVGFDAGDCANDECEIGDPLDADCVAAVAVACQCRTCTADDQASYYIGCFTDSPAGTRDVFMCINEAADCPAVQACVTGG